jgi:hypothetical protein
VEDGLLVQDVSKYSTSGVLGRDWREVVSEYSDATWREVASEYSDGVGWRMVSLCKMYQSIVLLVFLVAIGERLYQSCPDTSRNHGKSATGSLILCRN